MSDLAAVWSPNAQTPQQRNEPVDQMLLLQDEIDECALREQGVYARIGREAWPRIADDPALGELARELQDAQAQLAAAREKLAAAQAEQEERERQERERQVVPKCSACGVSIDPSMKFCPGCGQKVSAHAKAFCPECGCETQPGALFCSECGYRLNA